MALAAPPKKKKVRVINPERVNEKITKKQQTTDGQSKARTKIEDIRKKLAEKMARKTKLEEYAKQAKLTVKDKVLLKEELEKVKKELVQNNIKMRDAQAEETKFTQ